ncbi:MAG: pseudouridine synthase [Flavobacteriales bacterium]
MEGKRVNKFLSETGFCSRRVADSLIEDGRVMINGVTATLGSRVQEDVDEVKVDGKIVGTRSAPHVYLAFNKPRGIICTTDLRVKDNIIDYIQYPTRIFPVGRLDKDSHGLILLTSDGDIMEPLLRARYHHEKEYIVRVKQIIRPDFIRAMSKGVAILDTVTLPCVVEPISKDSFRIILTQGLNRQIRRMCEALGYDVVSLKRVRVVNIHLDIPNGKWRHLRTEELEALRGQLGLVDTGSDVEDSWDD